MRAANLRSWLVLLAIFCHWVFAQNLVSAAASAGPTTADRKRNADAAEDYAAAGENGHTPGFAFAAAIRAERALASAAPTKKVRRTKKPPAKPADTAQTAAPAPAAASQSGSSGSSGAGSATAQASPRHRQGLVEGSSPIGQLTTGDSALGERTKHETADLISETQQGLNGIKRSLSTRRESHRRRRYAIPETGPAGTGQWRYRRSAYCWRPKPSCCWMN